MSGNLEWFRGGVNVTFGWDNCSEREDGDNSIHWDFIDGIPEPTQFNTYATTTHCFTDNPTALELSTSSVRMDSGDNWYTGTANPPSSRVDTWALSAHEFGHMGGFGTGPADHFQGPECQDPKQTMCQGLPYGAVFWRSLEEHDRHTFNGAY